MKISLTRLTPLLVALKTADAVQLIPCPDCVRDVSRRALMCPNCGLKGEVIAEAAKGIPEVAAGDVLDVDCGTCAAHALPVEMSDGKFAVLPFDPVLGAAKVKVSNRGCEVGWMVPELAIDAPIVLNMI